jgi:hypothetical protein
MLARIRLINLFLTLVWLVTAAVPVEVRAESFWEKVLRFTGISASSSLQKGIDDEPDAGDIWVIHLAHKTRQRITWDGGFRSPVFEPGDETILAVRADTIVRIPVYGAEPKELFPVKGVVKLVGFGLEEPDRLLLLKKSADDRLAVGFYSMQSGKFTKMPYDENSPEDREMLNHLKGWKRVYGRNTVSTKSETKKVVGGITKQWTDVYLKQGQQNPLNISKCDGQNCGQPSLSPDGRMVVYIKAYP